MITTPRDIFAKIKKSDFLEVLIDVNAFIPIDVVYLYNEWLSGNKILNSLQHQWEASLLKDSSPDYSVYTTEEYLNEVFLCWKMYSRRYLLLLDKWLNRSDCLIHRESVRSVLDLGCGLAFTTIGLKAIFPNADCYGTNEPDSIQILYDEYITNLFEDIHIVGDNFNIGRKFDVVFASEFFEHLQNPIEFLEKILQTYQPEYIIFANTFTNMAIGHFYQYYYRGQLVDREKLPMLFSKHLKYNGYVKVKTNFYNNRPNVYMRLNDTRRLF